ncbi:MAG: right-handed parallel beta-helix repeat-containing protein [Saprospiraceae bacterium]|nr:right-handed parallel beta-helix repeat-containing protein [Saprospiraceae bacterium]
MRYCYGLLFVLLSLSSFSRSYYVSTKGSDQNKGNHWFVPLKTLEKAQELARPGDTVHIMRGDYYTTGAYLFEVKRNGEEGKWIVYKNYLNHKPVLYSGSRGVLNLTSSRYISIEGLTLDVKNDWIADTDSILQTGISIRGTYQEPSSHLKVYNCFFKNFKGPAISLENYDMITLSYNKFYNNATDPGGIAVLAFSKPVETQSMANYHLYVQANVFEKNSIAKSDSRPVCNPLMNFEYSKSNLLNSSKHAFIYNNLMYTNGGGGINVEHAVGFTIMHNTFYKNSENDSCAFPEITISYSTAIQVANNILYTSSAKPASRIINSVESRFLNNLYYNFSSKEPGTNDLVAHPEFEITDHEKNEFNFRLKGNSPAINAGIDEHIPDIDFEGNPRKFDLHTDLGALEYMQRTLPSLKNIKAGPQTNKIKTYWSSLYLQDQKIYTLWNQANLPFFIRIYDSFGEMIHQELAMDAESSSYEFDFNKYANGVYTIVAFGSEKLHYERVKIFPRKQK